MGTTTEPKIETRAEKPCLGIRTKAAIHELPTVIPQLGDEVAEWMQTQGVEPTEPSYIRYYVINMEEKLDVEIGWFVPKAMEGNGRIESTTIPAGDYATLLYTGDYDGLMDANRVLVEWARDNGVAWDRWDDPNGDAFRSRYELYIRDPGNEPDPAKWETEVAIKVADK